ncbi:MAG: ribonuclease H-like domain-containing protein [Candidatus Nanohaloarchaea archaeon]
MVWTHGAFDIEATGLGPTSTIITIGVWKQTRDGEVAEECYSLRQMDEKGLIDSFTSFFSEPGDEAQLYTYNGTTYDFPLLWARALKNGDFDSFCQLLERIQSCHCDLYEYRKQVLDRYKGGLEEAAANYGIEHGSDVCGSKVCELFRQGRVEKIEDYQMEDVRVTVALAEELVNEDRENGTEFFQ